MITRTEAIVVYGSSQGSTNGTTPVTAVGAPPTGSTREVVCFRLVNKDSGKVVARLRKIHSSVAYEFDNAELNSDEPYWPITEDSHVALTEAGQSLSVVLDSTPTTESTWIAAWRDTRTLQ